MAEKIQFTNGLGEKKIINKKYLPKVLSEFEYLKRITLPCPALSDFRREQLEKRWTIVKVEEME